MSDILTYLMMLQPAARRFNVNVTVLSNLSKIISFADDTRFYNNNSVSEVGDCDLL